MPSLWAPYKEYTDDCCYMKSFYGTLSGILNNFDRGKNVAFSGLIREICYGVGTEYLRSGSNRSVEKPLSTVSKTAFHGFNRAVIIRTERSGFLLCHGSERSGYPHVGELADYSGVDIRS